MNLGLTLYSTLAKKTPEQFDAWLSGELDAMCDAAQAWHKNRYRPPEPAPQVCCDDDELAI